ncbi:unnamed protein product [Spirodela intermedia]|uniref:Uncharacterized protein n=1 Tax=Spirodela intermedia TaxID=51605 RepID=A0A7I8KW70_SPIIN|nr:unnamed protein product [Spirodela intermedia]
MGDAATQVKREQGAVSCSSNGGGGRRQSRLHNFSFPSVSWGSHRLLRCLKIDPPGGSPSPRVGSAAEKESSWPPRSRSSPSFVAARRGPNQVDEEEEEGEYLARFRDVVMSEFGETFGRIPILSPSGSPAAARCKEIREMAPSSEAAEGARPWNLRLRRAACNAPAAAMVNVGLHKANKQNQNKHQSPVAQDNAGTATNSGRGLRSEAPAEGKERTRFSQVLSKDEIEDDFLAMTGSKPPRRPKKRPRNIQKQIEMIYPGLYLCEITPELYRTSQGNPIKPSLSISPFPDSSVWVLMEGSFSLFFFFFFFFFPSLPR